MKFTQSLIFILAVSFLATSCFKDDDDRLTTTTEINDFVWKGMNSWYNWQTEVPDLADSKRNDLAAYNTFINQNNNPESFFNSLRYQYGTVDRFSWFVDNYIEQLQEFQGISQSFGMRFQAVQINTTGDVVVYIRYVADNSPAKNANIKRGDIINAINGTVLNTANYSNAASGFSNQTISLSFVTGNAGTLIAQETKTISRAVVIENPVYLKKIFNNIAGRKVGYLVYNSFSASYNDELNDAFATFKNDNIDELILDLRLNGGGSVETSAYLASMIFGGAGVQKFADLKFNAKHRAEDGFYTFENALNVYNTNGVKTGTQTINRLQTLNRLFVLSSGSTASASEMVINGLKPFIPVVLIGTTTSGKNVGSITLYDSPKTDYTDRASANPGHLNAMQPIVFQIFNKNGESDYTSGFVPNIEIKETAFWNSILPFGDENEIVLKTALDNIRGISSKSNTSKSSGAFSKALQLPSTKKFEQEMYIDSSFLLKE